MRKRYQKGSLQKVEGVWIARWWEDGRRPARTLGRTSSMTKAQAQAELAAILAPLNNRSSSPSDKRSFGEFVEEVYLPFYRRKWKRTTTATNQDRIGYHLTAEFGARSLGSLNRDELQNFLDRKGSTLSFSVVDHLRWDWKQILGMAAAEGYLQRNPAALLFTPSRTIMKTAMPRHTWARTAEIRAVAARFNSR